MEKRVFSLTDVQRLHWLIAYSVTLPLWLMPMWLRTGAQRWVAVTMMAVMPLLYGWQYLCERRRCLEVSDHGLELRPWLRKPVSFGWETITKVELVEKQSFWNPGPPLRVFAATCECRRLKVSAYQPVSDELASILKQRLPESVFEER